MDVDTQSRQAPMAVPRWRQFELTRRTGLWLVLLVAVLTHLPTSFYEFAADDYLIRAGVGGDARMFQQGFQQADPDKGFLQSLSAGFHFYNPDSGTRSFYQNYGTLPWWSSDNAKMNPWRPLSAFTHWLDVRIAPDSFVFQSFHTLLYVLLMALCSYRLFWRLLPVPLVAVLASLLLVVDFSHVVNFSWVAARNVFIAVALGCFALERFVAWRESKHSGPLLWSLLAFTAGLLSAENSISILAYMGAYLLFVDRSGWLQKAILMSPYVLIMLVWRVLYNLQGFGASGIGLYLDPGHDMLEFLQSLLQVLPVILAGMITTLDGSVQSMAPELRVWVSVASAVVVAVCLPLIWHLVRRNAQMQFMLCGCVLAAVPACALISAGSRAGVFSTIGFFWLLALWMNWLANDPRWRLNRLVLGGTLCLHLFLPGLSGFLLTSQLLPVVYTDDGQFSSVARAFAGKGQAPALVRVNTPSSNQDFFLPFEWRYQHSVLPAAVNLLAPGLVTVELKRVSERMFELSAPAGLALHNRHEVNDLKGQHPPMASAFNAQMLQGLMSTPDDVLRVGDRRFAGNMRITVLALNEDRPSRLRVEFMGAPSPDGMVWQYYDWKLREYKAMKAPAIGASVRFPGPFDVDAGDLVNLCLGCEEGEALDHEQGR